MVKSVLVLFAGFLFVLSSAHYNGGQGGGFGRGQRGCGGFGHMLFRNIYFNLTDTERQELQQIFQNSCNETKANFQSQLDSFASSLNNSELSTIYQTNKNNFQQMQANITANITQQVANSSLSAAAQQFIENITSIFQNQQITFTQERQEIQQLFQSVNQSVLAEIENSGIQFPFGKHGHGGRGGSQSSSSQESDGNNYGRGGFNRGNQYGGYGQQGYGQQGYGQQGGYQRGSAYGANGQQGSYGNSNGFGRHQGRGQGSYGNNGQGNYGQGQGNYGYDQGNY